MRPGGVSLQPALFTRLTVVEDELSAVKGMLAELQVSQEDCVGIATNGAGGRSVYS